MRKYIPAIVKFSLCAVLVGAVIMGVAYATGARTTIVVGRDGVRAFNPQEQLRHTEDMNLAAFTNIDLATNYADVYFKTGDTYGIEIDENTMGDYQGNLTYELDGDTLRVREARGTRNYFQIIHFGWNTDISGNDSVTVTVPRDIRLSEVKLDAGSGDANVAGLRAENLIFTGSYDTYTFDDCEVASADMRLDSANIKMTEFYADTLTLENSYDTVRLINTRAHRFKLIDMQTDSLNLEISGIQADALKLKASYDSIRLADIEAGTIAVDADSMAIHAENVRCDAAEMSNTYDSVELADWESGGFTGNFDSCDVQIKGTLRGETYIANSYDSVRIDTNLSREEYSLNLSTNYGRITVDGAEYGETVMENADGARPNSLRIQTDSCEQILGFTPAR